MSSDMIENMESIIRFHRKQSGLSQHALADMAGIGKTSVFDIEKGKNTVRMDTFVKICKILNIKIKLESPLMSQWTSNEGRNR